MDPIVLAKRAEKATMEGFVILGPALTSEEYTGLAEPYPPEDDVASPAATGPFKAAGRVGECLPPSTSKRW